MEMFEEEIAMEKKSSSFGPLLIIAAVALAIGSVVFFLVREMRKGMTQEEAVAAATQIVQKRGPAVVRFRTGLLFQSADVKPNDPNYKVLERAGLIKTAKGKDGGTKVDLTPAGEQLLKDVPGVTKKERSESTEYTLPLAARTLLTVSDLKVPTGNTASFVYTWKYEPTKAGEIFNAAGPYAAKLTQWERINLIKDYGADYFYENTQPPVKVSLVRTDKGWQVAE